MKSKSYKNRAAYKEITTDTPYLNIYTGQRFFIDNEVVPPKALFYVEDLNPYQRTISIVMDTRPQIAGDREKTATNIYNLITSQIEQEGRKQQQFYNNTTYTYPIWFEDMLEILYFGSFE